MSWCKLKDCTIIFSLVDLVIDVLAIFVILLVAGLRYEDNANPRQKNNTSLTTNQTAVGTKEKKPLPEGDLIALFVVSVLIRLADIVLALYLFCGAQKEKATHCIIWLLIMVCLTIATVAWAVHDFITETEPSPISFGISVANGAYTTTEMVVVICYIITLKKNKVDQRRHR